jgi:hypothetical protein
MKITRIFFTILIFSSWGYSQSMSSEITASSGEHFTGINTQLSWTIGEMMIETFSSGPNQLTQGFHQNNITVTNVTSLSESFQVKIFPNPTTNFLNIDWPEISDCLSLSLYDVTGQQLLFETTLNQPLLRTLDLSAFPAGSYVLHLSNQNKKKVKTFIILKIK